ncbi:MAG TPA: hypothetical protein VKH42_01305 [Vicinamibacterales bacterium]|nr:hypothetical protein [Vicinamibacterales bacterium]
MRKSVACVAFVLGTIVVAAQDNYQFTDPNVQDLFRYARMAVGSAVSKVKAFEMRGKSKVDFNGSLIDCAVNIKILLPDHYLRVDATATDAKLAGYAGRNVLNAIRTGDGFFQTPPENLTPAILKNEQARLARLLLGMATYVTPDVALTFRSAGLVGGMVDPRDSPKATATAQGRAEPNVAEVTGSNQFRARLVIGASSRMPERLIYPGNPGPEETMMFEDRREVAGLQLPFKITTTAGGRIIDLLLFDEIGVNPEIAKGDFKR